MATMTNWLDKIKNAKKTITQLKRKADTKLEKNKLKKVKEKADEIKRLDSRLKELKQDELTANKRQQISKLERKLTTSGKILGILQSTAKTVIKEGGKSIKGKEKSVRRKRRKKK